VKMDNVKQLKAVASLRAQAAQARSNARALQSRLKELTEIDEPFISHSKIHSALSTQTHHSEKGVKDL